MKISAHYRLGRVLQCKAGPTWVYGLLFIVILMQCEQIQAQSLVTLKGVVSDYQTGELLSFVAVSVKNKAVGAQTDNFGKFQIKTKIYPGDSLRVSYVGYAVQTIPLTNKSVQHFAIQLKEENYKLGEVIVTADPNPGKTLMKKVVRQNAFNNLANLNRMHSRRWELKEVDVFDPKADEANFTKGIIFGDKARIFASLRKEGDTLVKETPLFFAEKIAEYELTRVPFSESENVIAVKTTGFETDRLLEPLVKWNAGDINLYADWVLLFNKTFVSPVGQDAFNYYNFYILDSVALPRGYYNITFQAIPKDWRDNVFSGYFTVNDSSFALVSADLRLSKEANINFIEAIRIQQKYIPALDLATGTNRYALSESTLSLQYPANLENLGIPLPISLGDLILVCRMKVTNSAIQLNNPEAAGFATPGALVTVKKLLDTGQDDGFWNRVRPDTISKREASIYQMADQFKMDFKAKAREKLLSTGISGVYYIDNKYYIGPLGSIISYNRIEGVRFRFSVRTMEGIFSKTGLYGHLAYGLKDNKFKASLGQNHIWKTKPFSKSQVALTSDYDVVTEWYDQSDKDNIINSILRKSAVPYYRVFNKQCILTHDQQVGANLFLHFAINYQTLDPSFDFLYPNPSYISNDRTPDEPLNKHIVPLSEFTIGLRFGWHESAKISNYSRFPLGSQYPIFILSYSHGVKVDKANFTYQKWSINMNHTSHLTPKIEFAWDFELGRIFGTLPSLILHQPTGSDSWVMSSRVFNLLTPYEFTTDRYAEIRSRINFGGLLFDRIPIIRKLQLRERLIFYSFWGDLSESNKQFNIYQNPVVTNKDPYFELGVGIDNIFHLLSVNYIKRVNYLSSPGAKGNHYGIFFGMKFIF